MKAPQINGPEIQTLLGALKTGVDIDIAAHLSGLSMSIVYTWLEIGKIEEEKEELGEKLLKEKASYLEFWKLVRMARSEAIMRAQVVITNAAQEDWKAAAWWLDRKVPESYGKLSERNRIKELEDKLKELEA